MPYMREARHAAVQGGFLFVLGGIADELVLKNYFFECQQNLERGRCGWGCPHPAPAASRAEHALH